MKKISLEDLKFLDEVDILYPKPKKILIGTEYILIKELPIRSINEIKDLFTKLVKKYKVMENLMVPKDLNELNKKTGQFTSIIDIFSLLLYQKKFMKIFLIMLKYVMPEIDTGSFITSKYIQNNITETEAIQIAVALIFRA